MKFLIGVALVIGLVAGYFLGKSSVQGSFEGKTAQEWKQEYDAKEYELGVVRGKKITSEMKNEIVGLEYVPSMKGWYEALIPEHYSVVRKIKEKTLALKIFNWESISDFQEVGEFKANLAPNGDGTGRIFPPVNAAPTYPNQELYIDNDRGKFYRYITYFAQEEAPPDLDGFTYVLQGFTKRGDYISVMVHHLEVTEDKDNYLSKVSLKSFDNEVFSILKEIEEKKVM